MHENYLKDLIDFQSVNYNATNLEESVEVVRDSLGVYSVKWGSLTYDGFEATINLKATNEPPLDFEFVSFVISTGNFSKQINDSTIIEYLFHYDVEFVVLTEKLYKQLKSDNEQGQFPSTVVYNAISGSSQWNDLLLFASERYEASTGFEDYFFTFKDTKDFLGKVEILKTVYPNDYEKFTDKDMCHFQVVDLRKRILREFNSLNELVKALKSGFSFNRYIPHIRHNGVNNLIEFNGLNQYWDVSKREYEILKNISSNPLD